MANRYIIYVSIGIIYTNSIDNDGYYDKNMNSFLSII